MIRPEGNFLEEGLETTFSTICSRLTENRAEIANPVSLEHWRHPRWQSGHSDAVAIGSALLVCLIPHKHDTIING